MRRKTNIRANVIDWCAQWLSENAKQLIAPTLGYDANDDNCDGA